MIEPMIIKLKIYLPLKIETIMWDDGVFQMYGPLWSFTTRSTWRVIQHDKMIVGCYDRDSKEFENSLLNFEIIDVLIQGNYLKIDPAFVLSNGLKLEIFATHTCKPWTIQVNNSGLYTATTNEQIGFDHN